MAETILGYNDSILLYNNCMIRVNYGSSTWGDVNWTPEYGNVNIFKIG